MKILQSHSKKLDFSNGPLVFHWTGLNLEIFFENSWLLRNLVGSSSNSNLCTFHNDVKMERLMLVKEFSSVL